MGLDLYHHTVLDPKTCKPTQEVENISSYSPEFKDKFAPFIFTRNVVYIDWDLTFQKLMQMSSEEANLQFDMFMETSDGQFHFCTKGSENPWDDAGKFVVMSDQCVLVTQEDPHVFVKCIGGFRGGMKPGFFKKFSANEHVIDLERVKKFLNFCQGPEIMEVVIDNFIVNWTKQSFATVDY